MFITVFFIAAFCYPQRCGVHAYKQRSTMYFEQMAIHRRVRVVRLVWHHEEQTRFPANGTSCCCCWQRLTKQIEESETSVDRSISGDVHLTN